MLSSREVKSAITILRDVGDPRPDEINLTPEIFSAAEKDVIIRDHVLNVAMLDSYLMALQGTPSSEDKRILEEIVNLRILQCCQLLSSLMTIS